MGEIGAQVSSLRPYLQDLGSMRASFRKLSEMGYRIVQLQWICPGISPEEIAEGLQDSGLTSVSTQDFYEEVRTRFPYFLRLNELCGSRHLCFSGIPEKLRSSREGCIQFASEITELSKAAEDRGMILVFHPRSQELAQIEGKTASEWLMEHVPASVQMGLDLYHVNKAGLNMADWIRKFRGRMDFVHFKDEKSLPDGRKILVPVGQGDTDWEDAVSACRETGLRWIFAEQERWEKDAFVCMRESLEWLDGHI